MQLTQKNKILALSGGVGGAKLALGFAHTVPSDLLTIVVNTADDFELHGLSISPDLDTLMYTLADLNNKEQGWGLADESWQSLNMLQRYGAETWFQLGDNDLVTHILRSDMYRKGFILSEITTLLASQLGVKQHIIPMTNDPVKTLVNTEQGEMPFQHYFVKNQCKPVVTGFAFSGIRDARPEPQFLETLADEKLAVIVICPSNPFVSVSPILELAGVKKAMKQSRAPVIAVSPIVGGQALKGPASKMMAELNMPTDVLAIAQYYVDIIDGLVIDSVDAKFAEQIADLGIAVHVVPTVMKDLPSKIDLATEVMTFAGKIEKEQQYVGTDTDKESR